MQPQVERRRRAALSGKERDEPEQQEGISIDSLPKWLRDFIDVNNEMAGVPAGRIFRFLPPEQRERVLREAEKKDRFVSALVRLLQNPAYARLYYQAEQTIKRADDAVKEALREVRDLAERAEMRLEDMRKAAAELPGGIKIFESGDRRLYTEDGRDVTDQRASVTGLSENSPKWESYSGTKIAAGGFRAEESELETTQRDVLEPAKERMREPDHPPSAEELEFFRNLDKTLSPRARAKFDATAPPGTDAKSPGTDSAADEYIGAAKLNAPDVCAKFTSACVAGGSGANFRDPYGSQATPLPASNPKNN